MRIVVTATVTPNSARVVHLTDPGERREQYVTGLRMWLPVAERHGATLVFAENSGEDLERLAADAFGCVPGNLRLLAARPPGPDATPGGKGATEAAILDEFAELCAHDPDDAVWVKCTGRLFVRNFDAALPLPLPPYALSARLSLDLTHADARFFAATAKAWRTHLTGAGEDVDVDRDVFLEHVLAGRVLGAVADGAALVRLRAQPDFLGQSGTFADRRYDSLRGRTKRWVAGRIDWALRGPLRGKHY